MAVHVNEKCSMSSVLHMMREGMYFLNNTVLILGVGYTETAVAIWICFRDQDLQSRN